MSETKGHRMLKTLAIQWLREEGCDSLATEVRLPVSNFRVDVAGYRSLRALRGELGETFAVECKQSRADFLKDAGEERRVEEALSVLTERRRRLEELLAVHLSECRLNESLFIEYDRFDFSGWRHETWRRVSVRLGILENRLRQGVKFSKIIRYGCANRCLLAVEPGVVSSASEIPIGWGCLERKGDRLRLIQEPLRLDSRVEARLKLLERIAARNSGSSRVKGEVETSDR